MILTVLPGPYSRSTTFDDELSLRRLSSSYRFTSNNKNWPRVCVVSVAPIIFCCISPFAWCSRWSIASSWILSTNVSWSSSTFRAPQGYQLNSWWEIPSLPSMNCVIIDHFIAFRSTQTCSCFVLYLEILTIQLVLCSTLKYYCLLSRMLWEFHHLLRILDAGDTFCHIHSFLGPRVISNWKTDKWIMMREINTPSNLVAW